MPQANTAASSATATNQGGLTVPRIIALGAVLPGLAILAVSLRFYSRLHATGPRLGVDDWLILASLVQRSPPLLAQYWSVLFEFGTDISP